MVGWVVVLWGALVAMLASATPLQTNEISDTQDLVQAINELVISNRGVQEQLFTNLQKVVTTQEDFQRFLLGGAEINLFGSESTAIESEVPQPGRDTNMAFFTRSVVAALHSGNNTQLEAILTEMKNLNDNFRKYLHSGVCPKPFINLGEECFSFQLEDLTWEESRQRCLELGGDLAVPGNLTQVRVFIGANFPRKDRRNFWLGGFLNNKVWEWFSGDAVNAQLWYTNEPSGNGNCLAMFDGWERPLSDFPCENQRRFICEIAIRN